jgi:predicted nuclease of restriction endonuclease-like (RecB) superfamily
MDKRFTDIIQLIKQSRTNAIKAINDELINLDWKIGKYINMKIEKSEWGESVVTLKLVKQENYSKRELERQISSSLFERTMIGNSKLSPAVRESNNDLTNTFKDSYVFEFLNLSEPHNERDSSGYQK